MCILVQVYQHVHQSSNCQTINSHQAYIIISAQYVNNQFIHQIITKQWHLTEVRKSLAAVEQQVRHSDGLQHLGFPNPSQLIAARTILAAASASCLNQPNHKSQNKIYFFKLILLVGERLTLAAVSALNIKESLNWAYSLQQVPTSLRWVLIFSINLAQNPNLSYQPNQRINKINISQVLLFRRHKTALTASSKFSSLVNCSMLLE